MSRINLTHLICISVLLMMFLGACQPSATPTPVVTEQTQVTEATTVEEDEPMTVPSKEDGYTGPALSTEPITLRALRQDYRPGQNELFDQWTEEFTTAHPNIKIEWEVVPFPELAQKIQTAFAAGDPPDIFMSQDAAFVASYVFNDLVMPMSDYLSEEYIDDIVSATRNLQSVDGKLYMMPWEQQVMAFYFNRDMFEEAGIPTPPKTEDLSAGWTWDQAYEAWKAVTVIPEGGEP